MGVYPNNNILFVPTATHPTVSDAITAAVAAGISADDPWEIRIGPGIYTETITLDGTDTDNRLEGLTLTGSGPGTIIKSATATNADAAIRLAASTRYITIRNLRLEQNGASNLLHLGYDDQSYSAEYVRLENVELNWNRGAAIRGQVHEIDYIGCTVNGIALTTDTMVDIPVSLDDYSVWTQNAGADGDTATTIGATSMFLNFAGGTSIGWAAPLRADATQVLGTRGSISKSLTTAHTKLRVTMRTSVELAEGDLTVAVKNAGGDTLATGSFPAQVTSGATTNSGFMTQEITLTVAAAGTAATLELIGIAGLAARTLYISEMIIVRPGQEDYYIAAVWDVDSGMGYDGWTTFTGGTVRIRDYSTSPGRRVGFIHAGWAASDGVTAGQGKYFVNGMRGLLRCPNAGFAQAYWTCSTMEIYSAGNTWRIEPVPGGTARFITAAYQGTAGIVDINDSIRLSTSATYHYPIYSKYAAGDGRIAVRNIESVSLALPLAVQNTTTVLGVLPVTRPIRILGASVAFSTPAAGGTITLALSNRDASASATDNLLSAATFDLETCAALTPSDLTLSGTLADLILADGDLVTATMAVSDDAVTNAGAGGVLTLEYMPI